MLESLPLRDIVGQYDAVRALVEDPCDRLEVLLTRRVPDLQLEVELVELNDERAELHTHGDFMLQIELIGCHSVHQATFPHA